ncbi:MAG: hypothetical protein GY835_00140 [bacterium]|nr:hypothetical protein [bacterium]
MNSEDGEIIVATAKAATTKSAMHEGIPRSTRKLFQYVLFVVTHSKNPALILTVAGIFVGFLLGVGSIAVTIYTAYFPVPPKWMVDRREIPMTGSGRDLSPVEMNVGATDLDAFRKFNAIYRYEVPQGKITLFDKTAELEFDMIAINNETQAEFPGKVKGRGTYDSDIAYIVYSAHNVGTPHEEWTGLFLLDITAEGPVKGYFFTEDTTESGFLIFGEMTFRRNASP